MLPETADSTPTPGGKRRVLWLLPVGIFVAGVSLTAGVYWLARIVIEERDSARFDNAVRVAESSIRNRLDVYTGLLRAGAGFFAAHENTNAESFHRFAEGINPASNYPGVQGIAYAQRVPRERKETYVAAMRATGRGNFDIVPDGVREEYFPIVFIEPLDRRNQAALGFDMFSEPVRRRAMERARDEARPIASGKVTLVQEIDTTKQAGFLLYVPVYSGNGIPETIAERRSRLEGFVYSPFRMHDLLEGVFGTETRPDVLFEIFDGERMDENRVMFRLPVPSSANPTFTSSNQFTVAGQTWTIVYRSTPSFDAASPRGWTNLVAAAGIVASALIGGIMFALVKAEARSHRRALQLRAAEARLEATVQARTAELRETNSQLESFVYSIAHDLRAPLRSMSGYAHLLEQDAGKMLDETSRLRLRRMQSSAGTMDRLILDLIAFGRTARAEMELGPVDARKAWDIAMAQTAALRDESKAQISIEDALPTVIAHEATLGQAFANLLGNALKFVAPGVTPMIRLWTEDLGDRVKFWIEDNGIGIPPAMQERAFRVFERLHGNRYGGTGIGLSIVRKGVERMGGSVGVVSEGATGSRFWIELKKA